ncbi:MAG: response regulator transcription factor [Andreesenia angusta]|nr:response regulator transcription factor [Andreesenia angusta]
MYLEDDDTIREVIVEYLKLANYEVIEAVNGKEALEYFENESFDLAILDIMVPEIDGIEVLEEIRKKDKKIGIIMLSAIGDERTQLHSFTAMADDYIVKPVSAILLIKRIETILRRISNTELEKKNIGLEKDSLGYCFYENGKRIDLTLTEYLLLEVFYDERNRVFDRNLLLDRIYGRDYYGSDRVIDAHIKNLRKKLDGDYIKTIVGIGYKWR